MDTYFEFLLKKLVGHSEETVDKVIERSFDNKYNFYSKKVDVVNCSEHQKRLWFIDQFEKHFLYKNSPVYHNLPFLVEVDENLNVEKLNESIKKIIVY